MRLSQRLAQGLSQRLSQRLFPIERRWTHAVLDAIFPREAAKDLPQGILDMEVDAYLDETMRKVPTVSAMGMRAGFVAIALSPPFTIARLRTIDKLDQEDRLRVIEKLYGAPFYPVRQLVVLAKTTGAMLYCTAPASRSVMLDGQRSGLGSRQPEKHEVPDETGASSIGEGEVAHVLA